MSAQAKSEAPDLVTLEIDGREFKAARGTMIIQVTDEAGIDIPRFCYHRKLSIAANCRMCLVEVEKAPKPMPACATPVADGMKVFTETPHARSAQKGVMEFLLINHPLDCPICDQGGECELQDLAMGYGRSVSRFTERKRVVKDENIGPLIQTDMTRCIHCTRCVRFLEEIANTSELGGMGRGEHMEISTHIGRSIASELSGNIIDLCPVGALTDKPYRYTARSWEMTAAPSVSPHDATGSNLWVHRRRGRAMRIVPRENEAVNETWLSDRDRYGFRGLYSDDRIERPMIRERGGARRWQHTDWDTALDIVTEHLGAQLRKDPRQTGFLASPRCTVEELYLIQKLARAAECDNVDHRLRQMDFSDQSGLPLNPALGLPVAELETLDAFLLVGSNLVHEQPLMAHRLRKAGRSGGRLMVLNPVDWDLHMEPEARLIVGPWEMVVSLAAVARAVAQTTGARPSEPVVRELMKERKPGKLETRIAQVLEGSGNSALLLGDFAWQHPAAAHLRALARFIAEATGSSLSLIPDGPNSAGAWVVGALPHRGVGGVAVDRPGLNAAEMLSGGLRNLVLFGLEPGYDTANAGAARLALRAAEFVVSVGPFADGALMEHGDVLLPAGTPPEIDGTYVNAQADWQLLRAATQMPGESRPLWKILRVLGGRFGLDGFGYMDLDEAREEIRAALRAAPDFEPGKSTPGKAPGRPEGLVRIGDVPIYAVDPVVRRSKPLQSHPLGERLAVGLCRAEADRQDVADGDGVTVTQNGHTALARVTIDERVPSGCARVPAGLEGGGRLGASIGVVSIEKA